MLVVLVVLVVLVARFGGGEGVSFGFSGCGVNAFPSQFESFDFV